MFGAVIRSRKASEKAAIVSSIVKGFTEKRFFLFEYLAFHEERPKLQWQSRDRSITDFLDSFRGSGEEENRLVDFVKDGHKKADALFSEIVINYETKPDSRLLKETEQLLSQRLLEITQVNFDSALALADLSYEEIKRDQKETLNFLIIFLASVFVFVVWMAVLIHRVVFIKILKLHNGIEIIAGGNLDYVLPVAGRDEFSELGVAFNKMTDQLSRSYKSVQEEREKYWALLASIPDGVIAVDHENRILMLNQKGEELLGWKGSEIRGEYFTDYFKLFDEGGKPVPFEHHPCVKAHTTMTAFYLKRKDGRKVPIAIATSVAAAGETVHWMVSTFRDISQEKELEKLRMDFLSLASHQLRTPLSGTKWLIETMQRKIIGPITEKQKEYLNEIYQINERMIKLVFDMLNTLRLESGITTVKEEVVSISRLYDELSLMMASAAGTKGIILRNILKNHKEVKVMTDVQMLRSILESFVSNAINYSNPGRDVILDAKEETTAVVFFVKDSGIGIPQEEQKRIFERFYRASNAKIVKPEGTGLGLYIASMLAEKIGAEILFDSEEGKGSTFYLRVPKKVGNNNASHT